MEKYEVKSTILATKIMSKVLYIISVLFFLMGFFCFIATITDWAGYGFSGLLLDFSLAGIGVLFFWWGRKQGRMVKILKEYTAILSNDPQCSMDNIALVTNQSPEKVMENMEKLLVKGFLKHVYLDTSARRLVFVGIPGQSRQPQGNPAYASQEERTVTCGGCGATNKVRAGVIGECEFCGSKLS